MGWGTQIPSTSMGGWNQIAFVPRWGSPCAPAEWNVSLSQVWMCFPRFGCVFPSLDVFSQPCRAAQRELKKKSCAENPAVPLYATTSPAHTMGLHDQSSEPAPSSASNGASPDLSHHKGDQESPNSPRSKNWGRETHQILGKPRCFFFNCFVLNFLSGVRLFSQKNFNWEVTSAQDIFVNEDHSLNVVFFS